MLLAFFRIAWRLYLSSPAVFATLYKVDLPHEICIALYTRLPLTEQTQSRLIEIQDKFMLIHTLRIRNFEESPKKQI
jgi:hypothetical protein